jgi:hypothetical protein
MFIQDLVKAYEAMVDGTNFLYKCQEQKITRDDLENLVYPEMTQEFNELNQRGADLRKDKSDLRILIYQSLVYPVHWMLDHKKITDSKEYVQKHILNRCNLE